MANFESVFKNVLKAYLNKYVDTVEEVLSYEQDKRTYGMCSTCRSESTVVEIAYVTTNHAIRTYEYSGSFAELICALADIDMSDGNDLD